MRDGILPEGSTVIEFPLDPRFLARGPVLGIFKGRQVRLCFLLVGAMDGFGSVAEGFLGERLGHAGDPGALRPSITKECRERPLMPMMCRSRS